MILLIIELYLLISQIHRLIRVMAVNNVVTLVTITSRAGIAQTTPTFVNTVSTVGTSQTVNRQGLSAAWIVAIVSLIFNAMFVTIGLYRWRASYRNRGSPSYGNDFGSSQNYEISRPARSYGRQSFARFR